MGAFSILLKFYILYKCSACNKCKADKVKWVKGGFQNEN
jgi:hypothetical protein